MNHELVYKISVFLMLLINVGYWVVRGDLTPTSVQLFSGLFQPGYTSSTHVILRAYLTSDDWRASKLPIRYLVGVLILLVLLIIAIIVVRLKTKPPSTSPASKFKNPFKNLNVIIVAVILVYTLLQVFAWGFWTSSSFLFPRFSLGFPPTLILASFLLANPEARTHALRRVRRLSPWTAKTGTEGQIQAVGTERMSIHRRSANSTSIVNDEDNAGDNYHIQPSNQAGNSDMRRTRRQDKVVLEHGFMDVVLEDIE